MRTINIREARRQLSELVDAAEHGQPTLITRHGKRVARIEPAAPAQGAPLPDMSVFRESIRKAVADQAKPLSTVVTEQRRQGRY